MNAVQYKLINLPDPPLVLLGCFTINAALTGNLNLPSFEKNLHLEHATYAVGLPLRFIIFSSTLIGK